MTITGKFLLDHGYALAGSSYATTGFALKEAIDDQADLVEVFRNQVAIPDTTIAWGTSLGGMVTAGLLERHPELVDGGLVHVRPAGRRRRPDGLLPRHSVRPENPSCT